MDWLQKAFILAALVVAALSRSAAFFVSPATSTGQGRPFALAGTISSSPLPLAEAIGFGHHDVLHTSRRTRIALGVAAREVTGEELEMEMTDWEMPMILDVFATWCGPCVMLKPELEKVAEALDGECRVLKLDSDAEESMASSLNVLGLPTVFFLADGQVKYRTEGFLPAEEMLLLADIYLFGREPPELPDPADELMIDDADACQPAAATASACAPPTDAPACPPPASAACPPPPAAAACPPPTCPPPTCPPPSAP